VQTVALAPDNLETMRLVIANDAKRHTRFEHREDAALLNFEWVKRHAD
jgi:hypothetical protein